MKSSYNSLLESYWLMESIVYNQLRGCGPTIRIYIAALWHCCAVVLLSPLSSLLSLLTIKHFNIHNGKYGIFYIESIFIFVILTFSDMILKIVNEFFLLSTLLVIFQRRQQVFLEISFLATFPFTTFLSFKLNFWYFDIVRFL